MTGDVVWTSASFDGSGNVTGTATIQANSVALGTDTTGNYVQSVANGSYLTGGGSASEGTALTLGVDATNANTASKVVARDGSGNFSAGTITAALTGNASTATTLATARTIGGVSFNGSANINLPGVNTSGNQATSGNAGSATVLQTARTINGVSFNGSSNISLSLANLGFTGASNANYITNNNQLTNGAGYTTSVGDITGVTAGTNLNGGGSSGSVTLNLDSTITVTTVNAGTVNTTSDERAKKDITPITGALNKVQQLGGYSFTLKETDERSSGVIAQEVQKVMPELVQEGAEGLLAVQYGNMVGLLIEAIKEQQAQIDELKQKLNS
jgi:hypothetical protein